MFLTSFKDKTSTFPQSAWLHRVIYIKPDKCRLHQVERCYLF